MSGKPWLKRYDQGVPEEISYPNEPAYYFLSEKARKIPDAPCAIFKGKVFSYALVDTLSNALGAGLSGLGVEKGDRVGIFLPNIPQFLVVFFGILKIGGIVVALNPGFKEDEVLYCIKDGGIKSVICMASALPLFKSFLGSTSLESIVVTNLEDAFRMTTVTSSPTIDQGVYWLCNLLNENSVKERPGVEILPDDAAIFQYSGGTTGIPKAAIASHRNLVVNTIQNNVWIDPARSEREVMLVAIPLYHVFGMIAAVMAGITGGDVLILIANPRDIEAVLTSIETYKVTLFPGVPQLFHAVLQFISASPVKYDLSSLHLCISGSAPLPVSLKSRFESLTGARLVEGYGLSEAPTTTTINPVKGENRPGSIGLPISGIDCQIVSLEDGQTVLSPGECGELLIKGPHVMSGYFNLPEDSRQALRNGWLYTGDVAYMDEEGYFYLVDRKKDLIKVGGFQVWPHEVEEAIASHPMVLDVGVSGVLHPEVGEIVKAWVVLKPGQSLSPEEVISWCKTRLASYKAPRQVAFVNQLPRNVVGKLLRRELVKLNDV